MNSGVAALVVARERTDLLVRVLDAAAAQTLRPDALLLVDCSETGVVVPDLPPLRIRVVRAPGSKSLGEALARIRPGDPDLDSARWWWILHEDSVPERDCLQRLWEVGDRGRTIGAIGPKQMSEDGTRLLEVGIAATRSARRLDRVSPGEIDQGQYDATSDVLAVGTAGLLVSGAAWDAVGGLDPALGPFGDGLDFGRRLHRAGFRVVVSPGARVRHSRLSLAPAPPIDEGGADPDGRTGASTDEAETPTSHDDRADASFAARRFAQLYNWAKAVPAPVLALLALWLLVLSPSRALARLVSGRQDLAGPEMRAWGRLVASTPKLLRARRAAAKSATVPASALRPLETSAHDLRRRKKDLSRLGETDPGEIDPLVLESSRAHRARSRSVLLLVLVLVGAAACARWWAMGPALVGGAWRSLPADWRGLWEAAWSTWVPGGDGLPGPADPFLVPLALIVAPFGALGAAPTAVATGLLFVLAPLAALTAWRFASALTTSAGARAAAAIAWSALPALTASQTQGRLAPALFHALLPLAASAWSRLLADPLPVRVEGSRALVAAPASRRSGDLARLALVSTFLVACVPWTLALLVAALLVLLLEGRARWGALLALAPSAALVLPMLTSALARGAWRALLAPGGPDAAAPQPRAWAAVLGLPVEPDSPALLALLALPGALLLLCALLSALLVLLSSNPSRRAKAAPLAFAFGATLLAAAAALSRIDVGLVGGRVASVWSAPLLSLGSLALLAAILLPTGVPRAWTSTPMRRVGAAAGALSLVLLASVCAPVVERALERESDAALTVAERLNSPRLTASPGLVAAVSAQAQASTRGGRVLLLDASEDLSTLDAALWRGAGPSILDSTPLSRALALRALLEGREADPATASLRGLVLTLAVYPDAQTVEGLVAHGVDTILVRSDSAGAPRLKEALDRAPGLERIGETGAGILWRARPDGARPARARIVGPPDAPDLDSSLVGARGAIPEGSAGEIRLAERADPGWTASLDGRRLEATSADGWAQAFVLDGSGALEIDHATPWALPWRAAALSTLALAALASIPWRRRR